MKEFKDYGLELSRCVHCGACRSVCPTFGVIRREAASARGKMSLMEALQRGEIELSDTVIKHISECVLCGACQECCANDIPVPDIIMAARAEIVGRKGLPFIASALMKGLRRPDNIIFKGVKAASLFKGVFFKKVPDSSGLVRRYPLPFVEKGRLVPTPASRFFLDIIDRRPKRDSLKTRSASVKKGGGSGIKIGFFAGCMVNFIMPDLGMAAVEVLEYTGAELFIPHEQTCCGMPAMGMGDIEDAKALALRNLEVFEACELDFITTACATCSDALKRKFRDILSGGGKEMSERIDRFCGKVRDITDLLVNTLNAADLFSMRDEEGGEVVTYHDPCHLRRGLGVKDAPRELIDMSGARRKEMKHPCRCCGLGGSFNITNYEFSMEINRSKAEDIRDTGAGTVATACPGCIIQLRDGLHRIGAEVEVKHVIELVADRLREL